jgi:hypothetical protein
MHKLIIWKNIMNSKLLHLQIKIQNMSDESRLIRKQEKKLQQQARQHQERGYHDDAKECRDALQGLAEHRKNTYSASCLRTYTRINLLAYAFLRGKSFKDVEPNAKTLPTIYAKNILKVVKNFSSYRENKDITEETIKDWLRLDVRETSDQRVELTA